VLSNEYYSQELHGPYQLFDLGDFGLEDGGKIRSCKLAYATFGQLTSQKDNAILILTWYSGTSKIMEQAYIGPGRAIDPDKYFIIIANQIGNGLSSSPHNTSAPFNGIKFPHVRISDDVRAQHRLITEKFGIERLELVMGGSMGAPQTYEWAVRYPEIVKRAAPIAGNPKVTPHEFVFLETLKEAITSDPAWQGGWYTEPHAVHQGLCKHAKLFALLGFTTEFFKQELWRALDFSSLDDFLTGFLENSFLPMDPNNLLCMIRKAQANDVSRATGGDLKEALSRIKAKTFVVAIDEDMLFPPRTCEAHQILIPNSELRVIHSLWGHNGLLGADPEYVKQIEGNLSELLAAST
jgi:homoserine O-acetyltransferase/O-succinyltransferase